MDKFTIAIIYFENCESLVVPLIYIPRIYFGDIKHNEYYINGKRYVSNLCSTVQIQIDNEFNDLKFSKDLYEKILPFDRITKHSDITSITIKNEDKQHDYAVHYYELEDCSNKYQNNKITADKLIINICKTLPSF